LRAASTPFNQNMPIGGMIEVPAAAVCADLFARELDFLSIGTNDLIQYTMATDRVNDEVSYLYDPLNLGVLRLIKTTIDAAARCHIPVAMCGEMAGDLRYVRLLLGLGLREFSVHPATLLEVKRIINSTSFDAVATLAVQLLNSRSPSEAQELLIAINGGVV
jgi:phosphoenolpyruvate-protein phosphotransferase (PTS system enzyme I)